MSTSRPAQNIDQFGYLLPLLVSIAGDDGMLDTMRDVFAQNFLFDAPQGSANRRDLRDDIDAIAVFLNHPREAADLPLDAAQALQCRRFCRLDHP